MRVHDAVHLGSVASPQRGQKLAVLGDRMGGVLNAHSDEEPEALPVAAQCVIGPQQRAVVGMFGDQPVKPFVRAVVLPDRRGIRAVWCPLLLLDRVLESLQQAGIHPGTSQFRQLGLDEQTRVHDVGDLLGIRHSGTRYPRMATRMTLPVDSRRANASRTGVGDTPR